MKDNASRLLMRKRDLLEALRVLEQDLEDGLIDENTYAAARRRHEYEVAQLQPGLDALGAVERAAPPEGEAGASPHIRRKLLVATTTILCVAGALTFLIAAIHPRTPGMSITGTTGQGVPVPPSQSGLSVQAAQQAVYRNPRSYVALVNLGTAYLQNGRVMEADLSFQSAMRVDPTRAAAPTFHAMLLGAVKRYTQALALLRRVERDHPAYSRAWLMDGILSSHTKGGKERAVAAWLRFLLLEPQSNLATTVRRWIMQTQGQK